MSDETGSLEPSGSQGHETLTGAAAGKLGDAASWALGKAKVTLQSAVDQARQRAETAAAIRIQRDPLTAVLIAAGAGALLMGLVAMWTRAGARRIERIVRR